MKKRRWMSTLVGMMATGAALMNKTPKLKKMMPKIDKMMAGFKPQRGKGIGSMLASGMLGFGLAHVIPKSKSMME